MKPKNIQDDWNCLGIGRLAFGASAVLITSLTVVQMPLTAGKPPIEPELNPKFDRLHQLNDRKSPTPQTNFGYYDAWVAKFQAGKEPGVTGPVWTRQLGTSLTDASFGVATDSNGNVFISGYTEGDLAGINQGKGYLDAWVAKYSSDGVLIWKQQLGSSKDDISYAVATDSSGNVLISGYTSGDLARNIRPERLNDAWVAKYSSDGALIWKQQLGSILKERSYSVATDKSGNVFISGSTWELINNAGQQNDAWVAKYSPNGTLLWKQRLGSSNSEDDISYGVATDSNGNVFISGYTYGDLAGSNQGYLDAWVAKYSPNGTLRWKQQLGTSGADYSYDITTDSSGNVFISGSTSGDLAGINQSASSDAWVAKYSPNGTLRWKQQLGSLGQDYSSGVATDISGNVFISGGTSGDLAGKNKGYFDAWVAKYSSSGTLKWVYQLGTRSGDASRSITTDSSGNVFISGDTFGDISKD